MSDKNRAKKARNKVKRPPVQADPHKQKATLAQFVTLAKEAQGAHANLAAQVNKGVTELWNNQKELIDGLGAAEFNLRAHQKVMNAIAVELDLLHRTLMPAGIERQLKMKDVEQDDHSVARRIDWVYYHGQVDEEMKALRAEPAPEPLAEAPAEGVPAKEDAEPEFPDGASIFG